MPWKAPPVSELRLALCHAVRSNGRPVAAAARDFAVSRKTAHKWLARFDDAAAPDPATAAPPLVALADRRRAPASRPRRTAPDVEAAALAVRDRFNWGPRKIRAFLLQDAARRGEPPPALPSVRTLTNVLRRHGRAGGPPATPPPEPQRFERAAPNDLWQVDFKGPVEVARRRVTPFTVLDDHSRYLLAFAPCHDVTMASAWRVLWAAFAEAGLPEQVLCDNAFGTMGTARPAGVSAFDSWLIRLGVRPSHGRPHHPQTQGKVERLHGSSVRELLGFDARRGCDADFAADCARWRGTYNHLRPHEALGDAVPASRWRPSPRRRPDALPDAESYYPAGSVLRVVGGDGAIGYRGLRVLCGRGIAGQRVRVEDRDHDGLAVFYAWRRFRDLSPDALVKGKVL
jgi:transposase InsO family protein